MRAAIMLCALVSLARARAQDGLYDVHFGNYLPGRTLYQGLASDLEGAYAAIVLPDGRLVLTGSYSSIRLGASGVPDPAFGNSAFGADGMLALQPFGPQGGYLAQYSVARQADGKLLFAGAAAGTDFQYRYAACRTSADGALDASYGDAGCAGYQVETNTNAYGQSAALDAAGRLVVAGWGYFSFGEKIVLVRFDTNGMLDTSFGTNGRTVILRFGEIEGVETYDSLGGIAIDAAGRIVVVGDTGPANVHDFAIARLGADGILDTTFGDGGARIVDFGGEQQNDAATSVVIECSGRIIAAGYANYPGATKPGMALLGLTADGDIDTAFGNGSGKFVAWVNGTSAYAYAYGVAIQQDGRIVMAGYAENPANSGYDGQDMAIMRVMPDASALDPSFATLGVFTGGFDLGTDTDDTSRNDQLLDVVLQGGRIVAVGGARGNWPNESFAAIRLTQDRIYTDGFELP